MNIECKECGCISEPIIKENPPHRSAYCPECGKFNKHIPNLDRDDFVLYFGKYKDRNVKSMLQNKEERSYLVWLYDKATSLKDWQRNIIKSLLHV